jgi:predicted ABC-type sugar transport system permease subunit
MKEIREHSWASCWMATFFTLATSFFFYTEMYGENVLGNVIFFALIVLINYLIVRNFVLSDDSLRDTREKVSQEITAAEKQAVKYAISILLLQYHAKGLFSTKYRGVLQQIEQQTKQTYNLE